MRLKGAELYESADAFMSKIFRFTFITWTSFAVPVGTYPFIMVTFSLLTGKYTNDLRDSINDTF